MKAVNEVRDYPLASEVLNKKERTYKSMRVNEFSQLLTDYEFKHLELLERIAVALEKANENKG